MAKKNRVRFAFRTLALTLIALGGLAGLPVVPFGSSAAARAAARPQKIGGTWDVTWTSRRGNPRTGYMVIEQHGAHIVAQVYDRGGATATGSIEGSTFTLRGSRMAIPFTVTGRIKGGRMTGIFNALGIERRFSGSRRGRR